MERLLLILKNLKPDVDFAASSELVDEGILDSLDIVEIVTAVEDEFSIEIPPDSIDPDNFQSVATMWNMIERML